MAHTLRPRTAARRTLNAGATQIALFDDIDDIEPTLWDSLVGPDDLQMTHRFVQACQHARIEESAQRYALFYQGNRLAALACFCMMDVRLELLAPSGLRVLASIVRRVLPRFLRVRILFCGLPVSFGQSALRIAPDADAPAVAEAIRVVMDLLAAELNAQMLCLKEFTDVDAAALEPLLHAGYLRAPSLPFCSLPIHWNGFEEYLVSMRASYRRQLNADLEARARYALTVRVLDDYAEEIERICALYEQVMDRAPYQLERLDAAFFRELQRRMGRQSRAILIERDGRIVAAAILLHSPRVLTFLLAGLDYQRNQECRAYPNLTAELVAQAIDSGATLLELGQTSYGLKSRFGAETTPRSIYLRHRSAWRNALLRRAGKWLFPETQLPTRRVFRDDVSEPERVSR